MLRQTVERSAAVGHTEENPPTGKRDQMARQVCSLKGSVVVQALFVYQHNTMIQSEEVLSDDTRKTNMFFCCN